ncbi:MAG TPA: DUF938 domain-containing protein [Rhodospirillales bacterium]|nr:DUF938 domain-containing protein [Rhodospirillales bacterium]
MNADATLNNRDPILAVLARHPPASGTVLEVGSGTGQHAAYLAPRFPALTWQPSDPNPEMRRSIAAWAKQAAAPNLRPPIDLDARAATWPIGKAAAIICVNMIHISPWAATAGLMKGAVRLLGPDSILYLYGPYRAGGTRTAASNAAFDKSLKARNPQWGLRQVEEVKKAASKNGLQFIETVNMPNNNLSLVFDGPLRVPRP